MEEETVESSFQLQGRGNKAISLELNLKVWVSSLTNM
jgi:hypothetical protein